MLCLFCWSRACRVGRICVGQCLLRCRGRIMRASGSARGRGVRGASTDGGRDEGEMRTYEANMLCMWRSGCKSARIIVLCGRLKTRWARKAGRARSACELPRTLRNRGNIASCVYVRERHQPGGRRIAHGGSRWWSEAASVCPQVFSAPCPCLPVAEPVFAVQGGAAEI